MSDAEHTFLEHAAMVRDYASMNLSEADTRVYLVDPVLKLLGYEGVDAVRREVAVAATREFIDYELLAGGQPQALVEAKAVRNAITDQHAAQCVQYASVLSVRWCLITNGVSWTIYDAHARGALAQKHVATVRLDADADVVHRAWSVLSLFSRESLGRSLPVTRLLIERVVTDELARPDSPALAALRRAVKDRFGETVTGQAIIDVLAESSAGNRQGATEATVPNTTPIVTGDGGRPRRRPPTRSGLTELIDAGLVPPDAALECTLYKKTFMARVRDGQIEMQGRLYATPSAAAAALRDGKASNGWVIWRYKGELLAALRERVTPLAANVASAAEPTD